MSLPELLLIDKPMGITSFDVIRHLRRQTGVRKFGHAGTLDPMASGLMLIGVESGTKRLGELTKLDKQYVTTICIGESRTTGDQEGDVAEITPVTPEVAELVTTQIRAALPKLVGTNRLSVSAYSAIKVDGVPMYKRARAAAKLGDVIEQVPVRDMVVHTAELQDIRYTDERLLVTVRFHVVSGTYIRSLGEELGRMVGYPAYLTALRRTAIGPYQLKDAAQLQSIKIHPGR
jgi:tRNA pseudouridine55 synthase